MIVFIKLKKFSHVIKKMQLKNKKVFYKVKKRDDKSSAIFLKSAKSLPRYFLYSKEASLFIPSKLICAPCKATMFLINFIVDLVYKKKKLASMLLFGY